MFVIPLLKKTKLSKTRKSAQVSTRRYVNTFIATVGKVAMFPRCSRNNPFPWRTFQLDPSSGFRLLWQRSVLPLHIERGGALLHGAVRGVQQRSRLLLPDGAAAKPGAVELGRAPILLRQRQGALRPV